MKCQALLAILEHGQLHAECYRPATRQLRGIHLCPACYSAFAHQLRSGVYLNNEYYEPRENWLMYLEESMTDVIR